MRPDMHKVVTTRPRAGGRSPVKTREANRSPDDLPSKEGMRRKWVVGGNPKEFSDLIAPLKRALRKNVGRLWDKVYSEVVASLPKGIVRHHILQHVEWEVQTHVIITETGPAYATGALWGCPFRAGQLYVDPNTGILREVKRRKNDAHKRGMGS